MEQQPTIDPEVQLTSAATSVSRPGQLRRSWPRPKAGVRTPWSAFGTLSFALALVGGTVAASATAGAEVICDPNNQDQCQVIDTVQTPAGRVSVSVSEGNVVTVRLTPISANTRFRGVAGNVPAERAGFERTTVEAAGAGTVYIDTKVVPAGSPTRRPNLVVVGIHPPSPCRARTDGNTVVFTPVRKQFRPAADFA